MPRYIQDPVHFDEMLDDAEEATGPSGTKFMLRKIIFELCEVLDDMGRESSVELRDAIRRTGQ